MLPCLFSLNHLKADSCDQAGLMKPGRSGVWFGVAEESESCAVPEGPSTTMEIILIPLTIIADKAITKRQIHWFVHDVPRGITCFPVVICWFLECYRLHSFRWATDRLSCPNGSLNGCRRFGQLRSRGMICPTGIFCFKFQGFLLTQFFSEQPFQVATATWIPVGPCWVSFFLGFGSRKTRRSGRPMTRHSTWRWWRPGAKWMRSPCSRSGVLLLG